MATWILTRDQPKQFSQAFNRLASTKGGSVDEVKMEGYFETLGDLPIDSVCTAASEFQKEATPFLPDAGTWYRRADDLAARQLEQHAEREVKRVTGPNTVECVCALCRDSGWKPVPPSTQEFESYGAAGGQGTVERCVCFATNPVLKAQRARSGALIARGKRA
jgi:sulfur transfer complex TusBCD TusB component (DsrH family)